MTSWTYTVLSTLLTAVQKSKSIHIGIVLYPVIISLSFALWAVYMWGDPELDSVSINLGNKHI